MRLMITVQATKNVGRLVNSGGVIVIIKNLPVGLYKGRENEELADFIAKEAGEARKRYAGEFAPAVAVQIIP